MHEVSCDVLILGGGTGGCAAAMAATSLGKTVILTEETDWIGGQLTAQAVPPDEHPWIEMFGCTARYRRYRELVRQFYCDHTPLLPDYRSNPRLNPGGGWVSKLCHEPRIGLQVLQQMLQPGLSSGRLTILLNTLVEGSFSLSEPEFESGATDWSTGDELIRSVPIVNIFSGKKQVVHARYILDATELGDLLPLVGAEYVAGAEAKSETQEPNATEVAEPDNVQGITWCMALAHDAGSNRVIDKPERYEFWKSYKPEFWPGPLLGFDVLHAHTGEPRKLPLFSDNWYALFPYRQIVDPSRFESGYHPHPVTIVNWPQNDYFTQNITDVSRETFAKGLADCYQLSLSLLYWLQTEAPRHDGGVGYPGLYLRSDITGRADGFAKTAYIRESRRIRARQTVLEQDVAAYTNPGMDRAPELKNSVGVGAYRIDLHPSTNGANTIDTSTLPFQIPLGSLVSTNRRNLIPACKNIGVTHITNGCYRLHPVEWNIGEAAGALAAFCISRDVEPAQVFESVQLTTDFQALLTEQGIELSWPMLRAL